MSVLVKNMEMPISCADCLFKTLSPTGESIVCDIILSTVPWEDRPFDCPLIEVPPHGRLIDADALAKNVTGAIYHSELRAAPTIIPAEEGE